MVPALWPINWENNLSIRRVSLPDAAAIVQIYNHFINETVVTFEEVPVSKMEMERRILEVFERGLPWTVWQNERAEILGYAYANRFRERVAYRFTVETTVYLDPNAIGQGIGYALYSDLIQRLKELKLHLAVGGIALPNEASVKLHERLGFEQVGIFSEVGFKFDRWVDVGFWQLELK